MSAWSPPDLPTEIVESARTLLLTDGFFAEFNWEKGPDLEPTHLETLLVWPSEEAGSR